MTDNATPTTPALSLEQILNGAIAATGPVAAVSNVSTYGINDESVTSNEFDYYKLGKDRVDRLSILMPSKITGARTHYVDIEDKKGFYICGSKWVKSGQTESIQQPAGLCCQRLDAPRQRFAALVVHYHTTPKGEPVKPFGYALKVWRFSAQTFEMLRAANTEFPFSEHDIKVTLDGDEKYQKASITACRESISVQILPALPSFGTEVQAWVTSVYPKIDKALGRSLTPAQWAELLGQAGVVGGGTPRTALANDAPITDITQLLAGIGE